MEVVNRGIKYPLKISGVVRSVEKRKISLDYSKIYCDEETAGDRIDIRA